MSDLFTTLVQGLSRGGGDPYSQLYEAPTSNPWVQLGGQIAGAGSALYNPYASTGRNLATSVGSGLVGALISSLAANRVKDRNAENAQQAIQLQQMGIGPEGQAMVQANPRLAPLYGQLAAQEAEAEQARMKEERAMQDYQTKELFKLSLLPEKERIKGMYNPAGTKVEVQMPGKEYDGLSVYGQATRDKISESSAMADEMARLADRIESLGLDRVELQGGRLLTALDDNRINAELSNVIDRFGRQRSGAALKDDEENRLQTLIRGDFSASPVDAAELLRKAAANELRFVKNMYKQGVQRQKSPDEYIRQIDSELDSLTAQRPEYGTPNKQTITIRLKDGSTREVTTAQAKALGIGGR